jgi:hypothetical protein
MAGVRETQTYPTAPLTTALGDLVVAVTDARHMHVATQGVDAIIVRGVPYRGGLHLYENGGRWQQREYHDLNVWRADGTQRDASDAARRTIIETIESAVNEWAPHHREVITAAARVNVANREAYVRREIAKLESALAAKRSELTTIIGERRAIDVTSRLC